ncbi:MAG: C2H2-type zinc finger protein [Thermofilum sp.]
MGIMPVINRSQVILDDSFAGGSLDVNGIAKLTARMLLDLGIRFRGITSSESEVVVEDEGSGEGGSRGPSFFICPHCGFITPYEEEYWNHVRIHYIGF